MFAVPGWAVSTASLVQERHPSKSESPRSAANSSAASKKRKIPHPHDNPASKISGSDLERLWNQRTSSKPSRAVESTKPHCGQRDDASERSHTTARADELSKSEKDDRKRKNRDKSRRQSSDQGQSETDHTPKNGAANGKISTGASTTRAVMESLPPAPPPTTKLTPLQAKMRSKLTSARFRHLNETLYTTSSSSAMDLFTSSPDLFAEYHTGFSQQVKDSWPVNPVDKYISTIKTRGQDIAGADSKLSGQPGPLPRRKTGSCTVADLGCGDAPLARGCQSQIKNLKLKFHNFDLHASNSLVTKADISSLPLRDGEADIAVFCLSLMGTNWLAFVEEAWRILRGDGKGEVWVSEVKSRFGRVHRQPGHVVENSVGKRRKKQKPKNENDDGEDQRLGEEVFAEDSANASTSNDETDITAFVKVFSRRGFMLREGSVDKSNRMFVSMIFVKSGVPTAGKYKGLKWNGHEYQKIPEGRKGRGVGGGGNDADDIPAAAEEAKVLKPCVYKTR